MFRIVSHNDERKSPFAQPELRANDGCQREKGYNSALFAKGRIKELDIPHSNKKVKYDELQRIGIGKSKLGASKAIALGAFAYAVEQLNKK